MDGLTRAERRRAIADLDPPGQLREWPLYVVREGRSEVHRTRRWSTWCGLVPGDGWREATAEEIATGRPCVRCERRQAVSLRTVDVDESEIPH